jgi:hypothetical protein
MKRNYLIIVLVFFSSLVFVSCGGDKMTGQRSSGKTAEVIVVMSSEAQWKGVMGDTLRAFFDKEYPQLPQPESYFSAVYTPRAVFTSSKLFKPHHNIFIIEIDKKYKKAELNARKNVWAKPQRVIQITAPDTDAFITLFEEKKDFILTVLEDSEKQRLVNTFAAFRDYPVQEEIRKSFHFSIEIPGGFYVAKKFSNFMWIRKETGKFSQGIMIYSYDFTDTVAFNQKRIISYRDSIAKAYIPGPSEGSYMAVSKDYIKPVSKQVDLNGLFAVETRGLWKVEGDFMGGPFINYTFVDEKRNKVITIDGYVYAPNAPKRNMVMQLESIIWSVKFAQ